MQYQIAKEIVPRDIAQRYFLVDVTSKDYYDRKKIYATNQCGYELFRIMISINGPFAVADLFHKFVEKLTDYEEPMKETIEADIQMFLNELLAIEYIRKVC